jgi:alpha-galactosidase
VDLGGRCSLVLADVGVDAEIGGAGSVVFEVRGGGELIATSGTVRGSQTAVPLAADVEWLSSVTCGKPP